MHKTHSFQFGAPALPEAATSQGSSATSAPLSCSTTQRHKSTTRRHSRRIATGIAAASAAVAFTVVPTPSTSGLAAQIAPAAEAQPLPGSNNVMGSLSNGGNFMAQLRQALNFLNGLLNIFNGGGLSKPHQPATPSAPKVPAVPGVSNTKAQTRTFVVNGITRSAIVKMPSSGKTKNLPIVFMYSGWQHTAEQTRGYAKLEQTGAGSDAIIVYPQGIQNAWEGAPYAATSLGQDVAFAREIVRTLAAEGKADRSRVYATGLSNGGGMALALACQAPDMMAGVVGVSGAYYNKVWSNCSAGKVPTLIIHGTQDGIVRYEGGLRHGAPFRSVDEMHKLVGQRNGCAVTRNPQVKRSGLVTTYTFSGCSAETHVKKVFGGAHTWYPFNPNAAQESWEFLSRHHK